MRTSLCPLQTSVVLAPTSGAGDDTYTVDNVDDIVVENPNEGTDTVFAFISYDLTDNVENLWLSGDNNLTGRGNALDNVLTGNNGINYLYGGLGDDTYYIQNSGDMVEEAHFGGTDTVYSTVSYSLFGRAVENVYLLGSESLVVWGNSLNNLLVGNSGHNVLHGEDGADTMQGGAGDDTYIVNTSQDVVVELAGEGTKDLIQSKAHRYTLSAQVEDLTLLGAAGLRQEGTANSLDNVLIDGHSGVAVLRGGAGNDTYYVNSSNDVVVEATGGGTDRVIASVSYDLAGTSVESLWLASGHTNGTGNSLANELRGSSGNNVMMGRGGQDLLNGFGGTDTLIGGTGDDTYMVDSTGDLITENAGEGYDVVISSANYSLKVNVEKLVLTGTANRNGTGNNADNVLIGNTGNNVLTGRYGGDFLDGGGGADTLDGGPGNDTYIIDSLDDVILGEGQDKGRDTVYTSVEFTVQTGKWLDHVILTGTADINLTGNERYNTLTGNSGINVLTGSIGNDTYYVQNEGDVVVEWNGEGIDHIYSSVSWVLGEDVYVEYVTLTGFADINLTGNSRKSLLVGNEGENVLTGGLGNDTYYVQNVEDVVVEVAGQGSDDMLATFVNWTLADDVDVERFYAAVENGNLDIDLTGNVHDNEIFGNYGKNVLNGGAGADSLEGKGDADTFLFLAGSGKDTVTDFSAADNDAININAYTGGTANIALVTQVGGDVVITLDAADVVTVKNALRADVLAHMVW